jgi:hypothetical protein
MNASHIMWGVLLVSAHEPMTVRPIVCSISPYSTKRRLFGYVVPLCLPKGRRVQDSDDTPVVASDRAASEQDQTASESDQTASDKDQTGSDEDQTASDGTSRPSEHAYLQ